MTLRLNDEQDRALTLLARAQGCSKHEAAVRAIVGSATRLLDDARLTELTRDVLDDHSGLEARVRQARS